MSEFSQSPEELRKSMKKNEKPFRELMIDFTKAVSKDEEEKAFFFLLLVKKKIIYNWGSDVLWVLEDFENEEKSQKYVMTVDTFYKRIGRSPSSNANVVLMLETSGIRTDVRNAETFESKEELEEFLSEFRRTAEQIQAHFAGKPSA